MDLKNARCPKCGEPARYMEALLRCKVPLVEGKPDLSQLRTHQREIKAEGSVTLVCGGAHTWKVVAND